MKPRRVFVTLEMDSSLPLDALRSMEFWNGRLLTKPEERVIQASANVAQKLTASQKHLLYGDWVNPKRRARRKA